MFYVKTNRNRRIYLEENNVYTTCPICGKEHNVSIPEIFSDGISDLYGTAVYCPECAKKRAADER